MGPDRRGRRVARRGRHAAGHDARGALCAEGQDPQTPHNQDEVYIVQSGSGTFTKGEETRQFGPGDVIFVEAGAEHRFSFFTDDFAAWAVFWGPDGGER